MDRTDLAALVSPKTLDTDAQIVSTPVLIANPLRDALTAYFATPDGLRDLANAPRPNGVQISVKEAVDALIEESTGL